MQMLTKSVLLAIAANNPGMHIVHMHIELFRLTAIALTWLGCGAIITGQRSLHVASTGKMNLLVHGSWLIAYLWQRVQRWGNTLQTLQLASIQLVNLVQDDKVCALNLLHQQVHNRP